MLFNGKIEFKNTNKNSVDTTELSRRISNISLNTSEGDKSNVGFELFIQK